MLCLFWNVLHLNSLEFPFRRVFSPLAKITFRPRQINRYFDCQCFCSFNSKRGPANEVAANIRSYLAVLMVGNKWKTNTKKNTTKIKLNYRMYGIVGLHIIQYAVADLCCSTFFLIFILSVFLPLSRSLFILSQSSAVPNLSIVRLQWLDCNWLTIAYHLLFCA